MPEREHITIKPALDETPEQRADRIQVLKGLISSGNYPVYERSLSEAILNYNKPVLGYSDIYNERAERRRAYFRDYMRRRRALLLHPSDK